MSQEISETNDGFIVGTDPKEPPRTAADWAPVLNETAANNPAAQAPAQDDRPADNSRYYTEEDIERVRREEKDKLYGRIESMDSQLKDIQREREEREAALRAQQEAEAEARRREEEEKMEVRDLLKRKEEEWAARLEELESRYETDRAVFEREKRFHELQQYQQARVAQESEFILPELRDLVRGNSEAEVDASIDEMKARTAAIMGQIEANIGQTRQQVRGAAPTAPPVGPLEQMTQYESLTPQDIASMDMETYRKHRERLLNATGRAYRG